MLQHIDGIPVFGDPVDPVALQQIRNCQRDATHVALMGDHHVGYGCPIGGVVASPDKVAPGSVGFDIACGNKAVRLDLTLDDIRDELPRIADAIWGALSFGVGRSNKEPVDHALFDDPAWDDVAFLRANPSLKTLAREQLGTIGSGNHFCDLFADEKGRIWVGVHFGSRGFGHKVATEFIGRAGGNPNGSMTEAPAVLDVQTLDGQDYLRSMELAGRYAYAGRDWVCSKVTSLLGTREMESVHNHHNFAWHEQHAGEGLWVVRKGATPAAPGQRGFVGGSMGDQSVILEGADTPEAAEVLYSTVHGAGRVMSRTQAAGKSRWSGGRKVRISPGLVNMESVRAGIKRRGIELRGAGADEAPEVYKRLPEVLAQHGSTIQVLHRLDPLVVCMAGEDEYDPYKD
jgi:tRNA-splicing ligase RtcB